MIRASSFPLTAPANAVRRAHGNPQNLLRAFRGTPTVRAELPFAIRRCINILREGGNGDRKTNYKQKEKPARRLRAGFNLKRRFTMRRSRTERKALTDHQTIIPSFFDLCRIRASSFRLTAPANAVRRAQASAEFPFPPRRCINILREGGNGDRKTNYKQKEKPARRLRAGFNLKRRFTMRKSRTEKNALTDNNNHPIRFSVCAASARRPSSLPGL